MTREPHQTTDKHPEPEVVIVGAGPNGLMLACELSLAGVRSIVLERLREPSERPKANGLLGQVVRVMDHRGLHERLTSSAEPPVPNSNYFMFGGLTLNLGLLEHSPIYNLPVTQQEMVRVLEERALELGAEIRRGHELVDLAQDEGGVTLQIVSSEGSHELRTRFVVGADGSHSATRKLAKIQFPGAHHDRMTVRSAHADVPDEWLDNISGALHVPGHGPVLPFLPLRTEHGGFSFAPFPGQPPLITTTEWDQPELAEAMSLTELGDSIQRVLGAEVPLEQPDGLGPHVLRRMKGGHTRLASRFADRRIFLIGDAAHVFGATGGGPGLNLGLQDAINLGWKLALVIHGHTPMEILDSFEVERRYAAERMVLNARTQSALIAPGSDVTGLRDLFGELLHNKDVVTRLAYLTAGADVTYDMGPAATHHLAGKFSPELDVMTSTGPARIAELTRSARPVLVDLTPENAFANTLSGWHGRVDIVRAEPIERSSLTSLSNRVSKELPTALLLRPDCYVAWASSTHQPDSADLDGLRAATTRWFGSP